MMAGELLKRYQADNLLIRLKDGLGPKRTFLLLLEQLYFLVYRFSIGREVCNPSLLCRRSSDLETSILFRAYLF